MPKQRHGCSFTSRWTKIACVLASLNCDNRIVESVYEGIANETRELFVQQEHKGLCVKTFGPQRIQEHELGFLMWKNGMVIVVEIDERSYVNSEDLEYFMWVDTLFNFRYNRVRFNENGVGLHYSVRSFHWTDEELTNKTAIMVLNNLALLSRCDFRFWVTILKQVGHDPNVLFFEPVVSFEFSSTTQLALRLGFIAITCWKKGKCLKRWMYYYHPMKSNVAKLLFFLKHANKEEWILKESLGKYLDRICDESKTSEILKFLEENHLD